MSRTAESFRRLKGFEQEHHFLIPLAWEAAKVANDRLARRVWKGGPNAFVSLPYEGPQKDIVGVAFPGFGSLNGALMTQDMMHSPFKDLHLHYAHYDNIHGADNDVIAQQLQQRQGELHFEGMDVYAPSMGFIHALEIAKKAGIRIRNLILTGSPSHLRDARAGKLGNWMANNIDTDGGVPGKFFLTFVAESARHGVKKMKRNFKEAVNESKKNASVMLLRSQMKILGAVDILKNWEDYRDIIIPGFTHVAYASSRDKSDRVVYTEKAFHAIKEFFSKFSNGDLKVPVSFIQLPDGAGHADTPLTLSMTSPWLEEKRREQTEHIIYQARV